jgi:hypothetical protein
MAPLCNRPHDREWLVRIPVTTGGSFSMASIMVDGTTVRSCSNIRGNARWERVSGAQPSSPPRWRASESKAALQPKAGARASAHESWRACRESVWTFTICKMLAKFRVAYTDFNVSHGSFAWDTWTVPRTAHELWLESACLDFLTDG